jgi:hypothetical protein
MREMETDPLAEPGAEGLHQPLRGDEMLFV